MSQKIGISRDAFQEWDFILSQSGTSVDGLQMGLKTLSKAADEASQGTKEYTDIFDRLNVSVVDNNGNLKQQEELFNEVFAALSDMTNETERTSLATQLLGRSATELAPAMNGGAAAIEEMRTQSHELGLILNDEVIDAAVDFTDNMDQLRRKTKALLTEAIAPLLSPMNSFIEYIINGKQPANDLYVAVEDLARINAEYKIALDNVETSTDNVKDASIELLAIQREKLYLILKKHTLIQQNSSIVSIEKLKKTQK